MKGGTVKPLRSSARVPSFGVKELALDLWLVPRSNHGDKLFFFFHFIYNVVSYVPHMYRGMVGGEKKADAPMCRAAWRENQG